MIVYSQAISQHNEAMKGGERDEQLRNSHRCPRREGKKILDRLTAAQKTINDCYQELRDLGVLVIEEETTSGN